MSLDSQISIGLTHNFKKVSLKQKETITKNLNQLKYKEQVTIDSPTPADTSTMQTLYPRLRDTSGKEHGKKL